MSSFDATPKKVKFSAIDCISDGYELIKSDYWLFLAMFFVAVLVAGIFPLVLMGPVMLGIFTTLKAKESGEEIKFEMVFKGFEKFLDGFLAFLFSFLGMSVLFLPIIIIAAIYILFVGAAIPDTGSPGPAVLGSSILLVIMAVILISMSGIIQALFMFSYPLIVDQNMPAWDATKLSIKAAFKNVWTLFILTIIHMIMGVIGVCLCYVGILFVVPIMYASWHIAYKRMFYAAPNQITA